MGVCYRCKQDCFWTANMVRESEESSRRVWICANCVKLAGGWEELPFLPTASDVCKAIERKNDNKKTRVPFTVSASVNNYLDVDTERHLWLVCGKDGSRINSKVHEFKDLISYELFENGYSKTSGGVGSAVMGGLIGGGTGAIVGSVVSKKVSKQLINHVEIVLRINDFNNPKETITILNLPNGGIEQGDSRYAKVSEVAQRCIALLENIIDYNKKQQQPNNIATTSSADEIRKYKALLDDGLITQEEFDAKKKQLLGL